MIEESKRSELKSIIMIDVDSTREMPITFSKPETESGPETREEAYKMVMDDIRCLTYGLATLIGLAHDNEFADKTQLTKLCTDTLELSLTADESEIGPETPTETEEKTEE